MSILDTIMSVKQAEELSHFRPTEILTQLFHALRSREREVLERRFGLFGREEETLEKIGQSLHVTRERIRQIERLAVALVKKGKETSTILEPVIHVLRGILEEYGEIMEESFLLKNALAHLPANPHETSALRFLLFEILSETFLHHGATNEWKAGWGLHAAYPSLLSSIVAEAKKFFEERKSPAVRTDLFAHCHAYSSSEHGESVSSDALFESYLRMSRDLGENVFGLWGLKAWPTITPKRMNDKIFLVLDHEKKPLHFQEITKRINDLQFDKKVAHAATVHNELILDERYVLVGRGLYALKSWGYRPGVVADIIEAILAERSSPMGREEIIAAVLKERFVAESTVALALTNKERFEKLLDGRYQKKTVSPTTPASSSVGV